MVSSSKLLRPEAPSSLGQQVIINTEEWGWTLVRRGVSPSQTEPSVDTRTVELTSCQMSVVHLLQYALQAEVKSDNTCLKRGKYKNGENIIFFYCLNRKWLSWCCAGPGHWTILQLPLLDHRSIAVSWQLCYIWSSPKYEHRIQTICGIE